jgi:hypothetical protein
VPQGLACDGLHRTSPNDITQRMPQRGRQPHLLHRAVDRDIGREKTRVQRAVLVSHHPVDVRGGAEWRNGGEMRHAVPCGEQLADAEIGHAGHGYTAVAPGLDGDPSEGLQHVFGFGAFEHRSRKLSGGAPRAARVDDDDGIAAPCQECHVPRLVERCRRAGRKQVLIVGAPAEESGQPFVGDGQIEVNGKERPVGKRDRRVRYRTDLVAARVRDGGRPTGELRSTQD